MKNAKITTALAAVTLAAATLATPLSASANDYRKCKDTANGVAGAAIGGSIGAAIGEELAGRGDRTEGAVLGAIVGGIAGAAIGDGVNDCEKYNSRNRRVVTTNRYPVRTTHGHNGGYQTVGHRGHRDSYGHNRRNTSYGYGYGHGNRNNRLWQVERELNEAKREREWLRREIDYRPGYNPRLRRQLDDVQYRIAELKRERKRLKKRKNRRNDYRHDRRGHYHGSSRNLCYSSH